MRKLARSLLFSALLIPALAWADDAPPRLRDLAAPSGIASASATAPNITQIGQYGASRVTQLQFKAGTEMPTHSATTRALVIVLSGRGHFDFSGTIQPLHERQVLHMEPGEPHSVTAETDMELLVIRLPAEE